MQKSLSRWFGMSLCGLTAMAIGLAVQTAMAQGYIGIFGGGPVYKSSANIPELAQSGFTEVVVWNIEVKSNGDLNFNGEFPLVSNGAYIGGQTHPDFASDMTTLKNGGIVKRITFSVGSSNTGDWQDVASLVNAQGTGSNSILYRNFAALKAAVPALDAIDFDDENSYDLSTATAFGVMLDGLGLHVVPDAYTNASYWQSLVTNINGAAPGTVDAVHLQVYSGGAGNNPCSGWSFGSVPLLPGLDTSTSVSGIESQFASWHASCGIPGGFLWLYDDVVGSAKQYAAAISQGVGASEAARAAEPVLEDVFGAAATERSRRLREASGL